MKCAWQAYLNLLPPSLREEVDRFGRDKLRELRLRLDRPPELVLDGKSVVLDNQISSLDLDFVINTASQYSPWSASTATQGYITAAGGHRVGICGEVAIVNGRFSAVRTVSSVCIRVARDFPGIALQTARICGSILIIGSPGTGKTTLLRDLIRQRSNLGKGSVCVVDERQEIFPMVEKRFCFSPGIRTDILTGCPKNVGITTVLRAMGPETIAVDEITAPEDCQALIGAGWCGVTLLATAHAKDREELEQRPVYRPLLESRLFSTLIILRKDLSWAMEGMYQ